MNYLFDASALMNLIEQKGKDITHLITRQYTLDLAYYELGNATWKNIHRKLIPTNEGKKIGRNIQTILRSLLIVPFDIEDDEKILELAVQTDLTYYDASYLYTAIKHQLTFVTDDANILTSARKRNILCIQSHDLL